MFFVTCNYISCESQFFWWRTTDGAVSLCTRGESIITNNNGCEAWDRSQNSFWEQEWNPRIQATYNSCETWDGPKNRFSTGVESNWSPTTAVKLDIDQRTVARQLQNPRVATNNGCEIRVTRDQVERMCARQYSNGVQPQPNADFSDHISLVRFTTMITVNWWRVLPTDFRDLLNTTQ